MSEDSWIEIVDSSSLHTTYRVLPNETGENRIGHVRFADFYVHSVIQTAEGEQDHWLVD